jgi:hypothetical protein
VPSTTPKKNNIRESKQLNTTTEFDLSLLLSLSDKTPFANLPELQWRVLIKRHGQESLRLALDVASESWRRTPKAIPNPGGYLEAICKSLIVPTWFTPAKEREIKTEKLKQARWDLLRAQESAAAETERLAQTKKQHWESLSSTEQDRYHKIANAQMLPREGTWSPRIVTLVAIEAAWEDVQNTQQSDSLNTSQGCRETHSPAS